MGRVLLAAADAVERETWLEQAVLERRTDRTIVDASALRDEIGAVGEQRWSLVEAELEPGLRSLAVPVRSRTGAVVAALNVATFSAAHSRDPLVQNYLPELRTTPAQHDRALSFLSTTSKVLLNCVASRSFVPFRQLSCTLEGG